MPWSEEGMSDKPDRGRNTVSFPALQKLPELLRAKGYSGEDIRNIMHLNFVRCLQEYF
jgi:microsomal dipeptidase-like Zn-dependent dipeptidase